jgi:hypothetical protein
MRCETDTASAATRDLVAGLTDPAPTGAIEPSDLFALTNLRLTPEGVAATERLLKDSDARMARNAGLDSAERRCFRTLLGTMIGKTVTTERPTTS